MFKDYELISRNDKRISNNYNIKYPFIKVKEGINNKTYFLGKLKKTDKIINNQLDTLLYTGFEGTEEDFRNIYGRHQPVKKVKLKTKIKLNKNLMINPDFLSKSIRLTKIKEFNHSDKNKNNSYYKNILKNSIISNKEKKEKEKENESKYEEKYREIFKDKSTIYLGSKCSSNIIDTYKNSTNKTYGLHDKNSTLEKERYKVEKMRRIKKIRNILKEKSNAILGIGSHSFQNENKKTTKIPLIKLENMKSINNKSTHKTIFFKDNNKSKSSKNENDEKIIHDVNKVFNKFLKKKKDDQTKLKKVLDPLQRAFKSNLKEVQKFIGNNRENIWMKKSTANLISFGNAFQLMPDDIFYRNHKRIIGKYPELEKEAEILVPLNKVRDRSIIQKMEKNERKIRFICNDNDLLMRGINRMYLENKMMRSKSQTSINFRNEKKNNF